MPDAPPLLPVRPRPSSRGNVSVSAQPRPNDPSFSLLLSLPRELRDRIYAFALVSSYPFWWPAQSSPNHGVALGLLTTSKQVHDEAAPILYSQNKFLFTHPSDANIFRVVASPFAEHITTVYLRIRDKDVKLWTTYLGSRTQERSLRADLPRLRSLWILLRCGATGMPRDVLANVGQGHIPGLGQHVFGHGSQLHAIQQQLTQQIQALQQQVAHTMGQATATVPMLTAPPGAASQAPNGPFATGVAAAAGPPMPFVQFAQGTWHHAPPPAPAPHAHGHLNNPPPQPSPLTQHLFLHNHTIAPLPPMPPTPQILPGAVQPAPYPQHHLLQHVQTPPIVSHGHSFYALFLRHERETGLEALCLSLRETRPPDADVKVVCILKLPKAEVGRLVRLFPEELSLDAVGDARTRFRRLHGVDVSLELSGFEFPGRV